MFKPTHTYHYPEGSNNKHLWPNGVPVVFGSVDEDGLIEWLADEGGNVGGYSVEGQAHVVKMTTQFCLSCTAPLDNDEYGQNLCDDCHNYEQDRQEYLSE